MKVLVNTETGKTWQIRQDGKYLYTANNGGKEKETAFVSADEATKKAEKDIWAKLKADFFFRDENAKIGNPSMLRYIKNDGYTGFMPVCADEKNDDFFILVNNDFETETLLKISENGTSEEVKTFPVKGLTFFMQYLDGNIFMNTGHKIVFFDLSSGTVEKHSKMGESPTSVLDISGKRAVWYDEKKLTVFDFAVNKKIFEKEVKPEMYGGHTSQLSAAVYGDWLAFCSQSEKIVLLNIANGEEKIISKPTNALTYKMHFSADGKFLYTLEQYGRWSLAAYNTENLMQVWEEKDAKTVCFDNESKNFAVLKMYCNEIAVYDANTQKEALTFKGEYIVKNAFMAFTKNCLAVYSDYGCLGLYNLKK